MGHNVFIRSALRQPMRSLLLLLLVAAATFACVSNVVQYIIIMRETERIGGLYRAIGYLSTNDYQNYNVFDGAEMIAASSDVDYEDRMRVCAGLLEGVYNTDLLSQSDLPSDMFNGFYQHGLHVSDVYVYAVLTDIVESQDGSRSLRLMPDELAAGYPEYVPEGQEIVVSAPQVEGEDPLAGMVIGGRYFLKAYYSHLAKPSFWEDARLNLIMKPVVAGGPWYLAVEPGTEVDDASPALNGLREDMAVLRENLRTVQVISTADMSAIPRMQRAFRIYVLAEGRWIDHEDQVNANRVCVVSRKFAELRGLSVGDELKITLRDTTGYLGYITDNMWDSWKELHTQEETFEIVGFYALHSPGSADNEITDSRDIYIPDSCMPVEYDVYSDYAVSPDFYSFVLKSAREKSRFLSEIRPALEQLGIGIHFIENGADGFWSAAVQMQDSAAVSTSVFSSALVLVLILTVFLYLRQRRKEFAVLRALGAPVRAASLQMLTPILLIGGAGVAVGGRFSWEYALGKVSETLKAIKSVEGVKASAELSPLWLAVLCVGTFLLLVVFTYGGVRLAARRPALELLQVLSAKKKKDRARPMEEKKEHILEAEKKNRRSEALRQGIDQSGANHVALSGFAPANGRSVHLSRLMRYVLLRAGRARFRSLLTLAVALSFTLALGLMDWTINRNNLELEQLYLSTAVEAEIVKADAYSYAQSSSIISGSTVKTVLDSGFVESNYLQCNYQYWIIAPPARSGTSETLWDDERRMEGNFTTIAFNRPDLFFSSGYDGQNYAVEYAAGWDEGLFSASWRDIDMVPVVLPASIMNELGLELGDTVYLAVTDQTVEYITLCEIAGRSTIKISGRTDGAVLLPMSIAEYEFGDGLYYSVAEFVLNPARNRELPNIKKLMESELKKPYAGRLQLKFTVWDNELQQVVEPMEKNISLLAMLFPVTLAVSVFIGIGVSMLMTLQNVRETAIMRVLGVRKGMVRMISCAETAFLCLPGVLAGLSFVAVLRGSAAFGAIPLICAGVYFAGAFMGTLCASFYGTAQMPLILLQAKE